MRASFEVVILPAGDPDRSLRFYRDQVGFNLDIDYAPTPEFRVIQLTPEGSGTSIQFGVGLTDAPTGSVRGLYLVVSDIEAWEAVDRPAHEDISVRMRMMMRMRSFITLGVFTTAALVALKWPVAAMLLIVLCLVGYLRPDIPQPKNVEH